MRYYATFIRTVDEDPVYQLYGRSRRASARHYQTVVKHSSSKPSSSYTNKKMINLLHAEDESRSMPKVIPETSINLEFDATTGTFRHKREHLNADIPK